MLQIFALSGGYLELPRESMICDASPSRWTVPIECFLVAHPRGRLLFDTGLNCETMTNMLGRYGPERARRFGVHSKPGDDVVSQLALLGLAPADVRYVANSHWHFDHCGANASFPDVPILVQQREMDAARSPEVLARGRYRPSLPDYDHPLRYQAIDGEHDVFGDGSVVLIPTYGHTPGHQSLLVRPDHGPRIVLTADACYTRENMDRDVLPTVVWDEAEMAHALRRLRDLRDKQGATTLYGHDPEQWSALTRAPTSLV
ncbi:MAG TPA: N-acyl homoserine lactonase family protein [Methylomirabilota bacterium]|nr:N-acyl homoserine lactonase family protein [Methylomirabilota bacterium]